MPLSRTSKFSSRLTAFQEIPVIDLSTARDDTILGHVVQQIATACEDVGFFYVINHGVNPNLTSMMFQAARELFGLPSESKRRLNIANSGITLRGYIPPYQDSADPGDRRVFKEAFDYGVNSDDVMPFFGKNIMPTELPNFLETTETYHAVMRQFTDKLSGAIALSLDLPVDYFAYLQRNPISIQRMLRYSPSKKQSNKSIIGSGAHTDFGFLTVIAQDEVGGIEVQNAQGQWVSAPPIDGSLLIGVGDLLQFMTNGRYSSTVHRVLNSSDQPRFSLQFFLDLDFHTIIESLPTCFSDDPEDNGTLLTCGQYKYLRYLESQRPLHPAAADLSPAS